MLLLVLACASPKPAPAADTADTAPPAADTAPPDSPADTAGEDTAPPAETAAPDTAPPDTAADTGEEKLPPASIYERCFADGVAMRDR